MLQTHFRTAQTVYLTSALLVILRIGHVLETVLSYGLWGEGMGWREPPSREVSLVHGRCIGGRAAKLEVRGQVKMLFVYM